MPPIEESDFVHKCVIWERTGFNRDNEPILAAPVEYDCRWVWDNRTSSTPDGTPVELTARVAVPIVVPTRSLFWKGCLDEWVDDGRQEIHESQMVTRADDIQGKNQRREYGLVRFRSKLPVGTPLPE